MITTQTYGETAIKHLGKTLKANEEAMNRISKRLVEDVRSGKKLLVFGSGHSGLFALELYHRAGGASFVLPVVADYLLPSAGPSVIRVLERTPGVANPLLDRAMAEQGEMIWIASQSGINGAVVDFALECKKRGLFTVAFTGLPHSKAVPTRHPSGKKLFEVCDEVIDLGGWVGDAAVEITPALSAGAVSNLTSVFLGHSILVDVCAKLEKAGQNCVYTSVNTPEGEKKNKQMEADIKVRDYRLR